MNRISEQLLQAFEVAVDEKISKLQYDKTIQAKIVSIEDIDTGEYRANYNDGSISVFAADPSVAYRVGDTVYVTVPEGDFSNKKFISHKITNNTLSTSQYNQLANAIFEVSPNFNELGYIYSNYTEKDYYALSIGREPLSCQIVDSSISGQTKTRFKAFSDQYEYIKIEASFHTEFISEGTITGDYGIQLDFKKTDGNTISYILHVPDFNGDPYHLSTWSPQSTIIKIPKGELDYLSAAYFYHSGFTPEQEVYNLFMKDFSVKFVEKIDLTEIPYYLNIIPVNGITFTTNTRSLELQGQFFHNGEDITSSCSFKWYRNNLDITSTDERYDKQVGWGWEAIEGAESNILVRTKEQVAWKKTFKLLAIYDSNIVATKEITLINSDSIYDLTLEQVDSLETLQLKIVDYNDNNRNLEGTWFYYQQGTQVEINETTNNISPDLKPYLVYSPMTFYCKVYTRNENNQLVWLGNLSYIMQNSESQNDVSIVFTGESTFVYDADGYMDVRDADSEHSLEIDIAWKPGIISSGYTVQWLDFNNNNIASQNYTPPADSLFKTLRVDISSKKIYYKIKSIYREYPSKNNSLRIQITTIDGQVYLFDKEILFLKTGDPGTNGTKYYSHITIVDDNVHKKTVNISNSSTRKVKLQCDVYEDDRLVTNNARIEWSLFNLNKTTDSSFIGSKIIVYANGTNTKRYVKATITINGIVLYDFFAVDSSNSDYDFDISQLPKYIKYNANGRNPQCLKNVPNYGENITIVSKFPELLAIINGQFVPALEFNPKDNIAQLSIQQNSADIYYHPIPMYINTFGNEAINGWDGVEVFLGDDGTHAVFAPQVGAGEKDNNNTFTGVIMGKDSAQTEGEGDNTRQLIGLYGYQKGKTVFGLMENGKAFFGESGQGRIDFDGNQATISGGGGGSSRTGMTIKLSAANVNADEEAIKIGGGNFIVTYKGHLTAQSANIEGTITAGENSVIGGWTLTANRLYSGKSSDNTYVALDSGTENTEYVIWAGRESPTNSQTKFKVSRSGILTATEAVITGTITANGGYIGGTSGWSIGDKLIKSQDNRVYLYTGSESNYQVNFLQVNAEYYKVENNAIIGNALTNSYKRTVNYNNNITISGYQVFNFPGNSTNYAAVSANFSSENGRIWAGNESPGKGAFYVTHNGTMFARNGEFIGTITATKGTIGGWTITNNKLQNSNDSVSLGPGGFKFGDSFSVNSAGATITGKITATSGSIGGWTIASDKLQNGNGSVYLGPGGFKFGENFSVTSTGNLKAKNANISGVLTVDNGGMIGNWLIQNNRLQTTDGTVYLGTDGLKFDNYFEVTASGLTVNGTIITQKIYTTTNKNNYLEISNNGIDFTSTNSQFDWYLKNDGTGGVVLNVTLGYLTIQAETAVNLNPLGYLYLANPSNIYLGSSQITLEDYVSEHGGSTVVFG